MGFGTCACGQPNIGHYLGGTPGVCQTCFDKQLEADREKQYIKAAREKLEKARKIQAETGVTLSEAILLVD